MSFAPQFDSRYQKVIKPAIECIDYEGEKLRPIRVDARKISDSILTEILSGIGNSRLFFADVTCMGEIDRRPYRNDNVMYEVGIATATRLPEEVLLFRSDNKPLSFDVANMRINGYAADENPVNAKLSVENSIKDALKEIELKKHLAVENAALQLDEMSIKVMKESMNEGFHLPQPTSIASAISHQVYSLAINKLMELGAITTRLNKLSDGSIKDNIVKPILAHQVTEFGYALMKYLIQETDFLNSSVLEELEKQGTDMKDLYNSMDERWKVIQAEDKENRIHAE